MSLNVEHTESSHAARIDRAEKPKAANGEGFAALLATLSAELRSFSGVTPDMALPIGAAKPASVTDDPLPRDAASDMGRGALDDGERADDMAAGLRPDDDSGRSRSERPDTDGNRDIRNSDTTGRTADDAGRAGSSDDGVSQMSASATTAVAGNGRSGEQQAAPGMRNSTAGQLPAGQAGAQQAVVEEIATQTAVRQTAAPAQSGAYKPSNGADGNALRASVVDQGTAMASQPNASLAASATVNAQLGRGAKPVSTGLNDGGLSLDDGTTLRGDLQTATGTVKPVTAGAVKAASPDAAAADAAGRHNPGPQPAQTQAPQGAPAMPAQLANTITTAGNAGQSGPSVPGQAVDTAMASSGPTNQSQAAARPRQTGFTGHMRNAAQTMPTAEQVAIQIQRAIGNGSDRITIQLRPQELGRVEVKMEVGHDGKLLAVISADKPDTLDLLQRDQRSLQNALSDAGLDLDSNSLSFNLNGQDDGQGIAEDGSDGSKAGPEEQDQSDDAASAVSGHVNVITEDKIDVLL